jgi:peptidoglycan/LPS O-acetylase OafA/YrhL
MDKSSRTAAGPEHVIEFDALRGVAILGVVLVHAASYLGLVGMFIPFTHVDLTALFYDGGLGVPLFFLLSGYLLTGTEHRRIVKGSYSVAAYVRRRFFRLAPAYYVSLVVFMAWSIWHREYDPGVGTGVDFLYYVTFLHGLIGTTQGVDPPYWSLAPEVIFYVSLPLLLWYAPSIWQRVILYVLSLIIAVQIYWIYGRDPQGLWGWHYFTHPAGYLHLFLAGSILASLPRSRDGHRAPAWRNGDLLLLGAAAALFLHPYLRFPGGQEGAAVGVRLSGYLLVTIAFAACVRGAPLARKFLRSRVLASIGTVSYSVFLYHQLPLFLSSQSGLIRWFQAGAGNGIPSLALFAAYFAIILAASLGIAWCSYTFVERPWMRGFPRIGAIRRVRPATEPVM